MHLLKQIWNNLLYESSMNCFGGFNTTGFITLRLSSKGHLAQDDFCLTMSTKEEVLEGVVNQDIIGKIQGIKEKKGEETKFFITSRLCVEEGTDDQQLWERHRPPRKVNSTGMQNTSYTINER